MKGRRLDNGRYGAVYADKLTKEFLEKEYLENRRSPYSIADEVGCSVKLVYNYLKYHNIPQKKLNGEISKGDQFGLLTTIEVVEKTHNGTFKWKCRCECGNITYTTTSRLKNSTTKSCGCLKKRKKQLNPLWNGFCDISGSRVAEIKWRAEKKGWDFDLDAEFLWNLWLEQENKCAISGLEIKLDKNASVDRIDSSKGYTKGNVWWTHRDINKMKMDTDLDQFIKYCDIISQYNLKPQGGVA